jgi:hypothetical protein
MQFFLYIKFTFLIISGILSWISVSCFSVSIILLFDWGDHVFLMQFVYHFRTNKNLIIGLTKWLNFFILQYLGL